MKLEVIEDKIYYNHRLVAQLEPGLNGLVRGDVVEALEGRLYYDAGYEQGWADCNDFKETMCAAGAVIENSNEQTYSRAVEEAVK